MTRPQVRKRAGPIYHYRPVHGVDHFPSGPHRPSLFNSPIRAHPRPCYTPEKILILFRIKCYLIYFSGVTNFAWTDFCPHSFFEAYYSAHFYLCSQVLRSSD